MVDPMESIVFNRCHRNRTRLKLRWLKLRLSMCWKTSLQLAKLVPQSFPRENFDLASILICKRPCPLGSHKMLLIMSPNLRRSASLERWTSWKNIITSSRNFYILKDEIWATATRSLYMLIEIVAPTSRRNLEASYTWELSRNQFMLEKSSYLHVGVLTDFMHQ